MSKLAALLGGMTLNDLAKEVLQLQGRRGDTELAHINKREAALLKDAGGSGTMNPNTGMQEFYDGMDSGDYIGESYAVPGEVPGAAQSPFIQSYGGPVEGETYSFDMPTETGAYDVGQPTPFAGRGQLASPPQENLGFDQYGESYAVPGTIPGAGPSPYTGVPGLPAQGETYSYEPGFQDTLSEIGGQAKELLQQPGVTRGAIAGALGIPGLVAARQARKEAAQTRAEMERMAAPIRQTGEQLLQAGQAGALTAPQQQQVQALKAAQAQNRARRGVTSGTAQAQDEARVAEYVQRLAQTNIDNGVRLIGAANSYNASAIQTAYKMNQDANTLTQNYFTNLMRAAGAIPSQTTTTITQG